MLVLSGIIGDYVMEGLGSMTYHIMVKVLLESGRPNIKTKMEYL